MSNNNRHGDARDRGAADSWYRRPFNPHYYKGATYTSERVDASQMTADEIAAYRAGYDTNEDLDLHKDWN